MHDAQGGAAFLSAPDLNLFSAFAPKQAAAPLATAAAQQAQARQRDSNAPADDTSGGPAPTHNTWDPNHVGDLPSPLPSGAWCNPERSSQLQSGCPTQQTDGSSEPPTDSRRREWNDA